MPSMRSTAPLLSRLRASSRLAVLLLLVFGLNLSAAATCVSHDFADLGLSSSSENATSIDDAAADDTGDPVSADNMHASNCHHGSCHPMVYLDTMDSGIAWVLCSALQARTDQSPPHPHAQSQLRPPIA